MSRPQPTKWSSADGRSRRSGSRPSSPVRTDSGPAFSIQRPRTNRDLAHFPSEVSMPGMPYNLERGPYLALLEDLINRDPVRCLDSLRDPEKPVSALLREPAVRIHGGPYADTALLADHIDRDWFGITPGAPDD